MNLVPNVLISEAHAPIANANNTDANTDILDMSGYDGVVFIVPVEDSANAGVATLTVENSTTNADTYMVAITGAASTATDSGGDALNGKLLIVDVHKPLKRYVQGVFTSSGGNIAFGTCIAIRYHGHKAPVTADATVLQAVTVVGS
jgi:hypothetical protein